MCGEVQHVRGSKPDQLMRRAIIPKFMAFDRLFAMQFVVTIESMRCTERRLRFCLAANYTIRLGICTEVRRISIRWILPKKVISFLLAETAIIC